MKMNIVEVINEVMNENASEAILVEFYSHNSLMDHYKYLYDLMVLNAEAANDETWNMVHYYESRYGLDYVNNKLRFHIVEIPSFEEWLEDYRTKYILR